MFVTAVLGKVLTGCSLSVLEAGYGTLLFTTAIYSLLKQGVEYGGFGLLGQQNNQTEIQSCVFVLSDQAITIRAVLNPHCHFYSAQVL